MLQKIYIFVFTLLTIAVTAQLQTAYAVNSTECVRTVTFSSPTAANVGGTAIDADNYPICTSIETGDLGFQIPSLGDILTFAIRAFFVIAGLAALFYLLLGALGWVTSGGDKDSITAARDKIQAAILGMILIVAVLAIIWTLEQVIFKRRICLGLSCPLTLPGLIETTGNIQNIVFNGNNLPTMQTKDANCCICLRPDGTQGEVINTYLFRCKPNGDGEAF